MPIISNPYRVGDRVIYTSMSSAYGLAAEMSNWRYSRTILELTKVDVVRVVARPLDDLYHDGYSFNFKELTPLGKLKKKSKIKPWQL